jgi:hypothetical protein
MASPARPSAHRSAGPTPPRSPRLAPAPPVDANLSPAQRHVKAMARIRPRHSAFDLQNATFRAASPDRETLCMHHMQNPATVSAAGCEM